MPNGNAPDDFARIARLEHNTQKREAGMKGPIKMYRTLKSGLGSNPTKSGGINRSTKPSKQH